MKNMNNLTLADIVKYVVTAKVEITVNITPEQEEISVQPWKPFEYQCPYQEPKNEQEGEK